MPLTKSTWGQILFVEIFLLLFVTGFLPVDWISRSNAFLLMLIYITSTLATSYRRKWIVTVAIGMILLQTITSILDFTQLADFLRVLNILFFVAIVVLLVMSIARAKESDSTVIFEAINGYLLTGIMFATVVMLMIRIDNNSFSFSDTGILLNHNALYFSFVTLTTLGYGDMLPLTPPAKTLSMLISVTGQIYLTVIIAILIGKYSNRLTKT